MGSSIGWAVVLDGQQCCDGRQCCDGQQCCDGWQMGSSVDRWVAVVQLSLSACQLRAGLVETLAGATMLTTSKLGVAD